MTGAVDDLIVAQAQTHTAVITVSVWRDGLPESPLMARLLTSQDGSRPQYAAMASGIDAICDSVRAFLIMNFS